MKDKPYITVSKLFPSGLLEVSAIINNQLVCKRYGGYTKRRAITLFRIEFLK